MKACALLLQIQNNQLEALPESVGALPDLKCLLAHGNKITALPTLRDCCKLEELQINENQIEELADDVFLGLGALHTLDMVRQVSGRARRTPTSGVFVHVQHK
jgi:Leucine-rich repeat (LRR) protein